MVGTAGPTQREYLGCPQGEIVGDTLWITSWEEARDLKQLQFAVSGNCDQVRNLVGILHPASWLVRDDRGSLFGFGEAPPHRRRPPCRMRPEGDIWRFPRTDSEP